ncbi:MAG TPA: LON peptidase substrate-binding domain-containing protein [Candidatus Limnocylindria bacterium]|jgi:Lon protease-like protein|nr:LON peptidase substrate-binding domain-containing protein [Candidatus Limnocylindria bacterium]
MAEPLPLFALTTVLFPEMLLPLHIFEPRYRLLVRRCMDEDRPFGVVLIRSGQEVGAPAEPHAVGTEAKIMAYSPLSDGRSYIVVRGGRRFAVENTSADAEPYLVGRVRYLEEREGEHARDRGAVAVEAYGQYLVAVMAVTDDARGDRAIVDELATVSPREASYRIAASLAVDATERQRLLELPTDAERLDAEKNLLERETTLLRDLLVRLRAHGEGRVTLN